MVVWPVKKQIQCNKLSFSFARQYTIYSNNKFNNNAIYNNYEF